MAGLATDSIGLIYINCAAIILMCGIIIHTGIYRRRGFLVDRLFFAMLVLNICLASLDIFECVFGDRGLAQASVPLWIENILFSIVAQVIWFLFALYFMCAVRREAQVRKYWKLYSIPMFVTFIAVFVNIFFGFLYDVDMATGTFSYGPFYNALYIAPLVYAVIICVQLGRLQKILIVFFILLLLIRFLPSLFLEGLSSTSFYFALIMTYLHIFRTNYDFQKEGER
ncbi:MAG: hypothetical protein K6G07_02290 [Lachnospiraceae bacterium]|nr:hypothetical protein [Lachnospiraceae bacterium]